MKAINESLNPLVRKLRLLNTPSATAPTHPAGLDTCRWLAYLKQGLIDRFEELGFIRGPFIALMSAAVISLGIRMMTPAIFTDGRGETVYWPVDGILAAVMLIVSRTYWPWLLFGSLISQVAAMSGEPVPVIFADTIGNLAEPLIAAYALPRFRGLSDWMEQPKLALRFILGAVFLAPSVAAAIYSLVFAAFYHKGFLSSASNWLRADLLGVTLALPLVLVLCSRQTYRLFYPRALGHTALVLGTTGFVSWAVFRWSSLPIAFAILPLLLLTVFELGFSGAVIAVNLLALIVSSATVKGYGPFSASMEGTRIYAIPILQLFLTMAMLISFPVGIVLKQRKRFEQQLKEALQEMESLASIDALTGIANRRIFDQVIEQEGRRSVRTGHPLALLMIDVDFFKPYNDFYGHVAGDECLRCVAEAIRSIPSRTGDLVARYGGEEFAVLLPNSSLTTALTIASRISNAVAQMRMEHRGSPHQVVTISIGCGIDSPKSGWAPTQLVDYADQALYAAKRRGRNRVEACDLEGFARVEEVADLSILISDL